MNDEKVMKTRVTLEDIIVLVNERDIEAISNYSGASWERDPDDYDGDEEIPDEYYNKYKDEVVISIEPCGYYDCYHRIIIYIG